ncbi:AraC family transcriptional regulator [Pseudomaricurvus alkylphenolicus]|uniref:AraC family transcriptional regulator n=1 Tax=Pseudomaricurvus alkylphenolicus TaxID=1306991 RepID=UPI001F0E9667|nr:AraC family transcriptional regulator [Pseudomaricurvus alkylphenolicus]
MKSGQDKQDIGIRTAILSDLLSTARESNVDIDSLLQRCDIKPDRFITRQGRVPVANAVKLIRRCGFLMGDEYMGLLSRPLPVGYFRMAILNAVQQPTLGEALQRFFEFNNLFLPDLKTKLVNRQQFSEIHLVRNSGVRFRNNVAVDMIIAIIHRLSNWLCDELIVVDSLELDHEPRLYRREYKHIYYGAVVKYHGDINRLVFDRHYLDLPVIQNETDAEAYYQRAPLDLFLPQDVQGETSRVIRKLIKQQYTTRNVIANLQEVSALLDLGPQTIRRRLAKEGTSYNSIKSRVKRDVAMRALNDPDLTIEEVAIRIGYSEPAAFIRAFKSWTGFSPARFRRGGFETDTVD